MDSAFAKSRSYQFKDMDKGPVELNRFAGEVGGDEYGVFEGHTANDQIDMSRMGKVQELRVRL